MADDCGFNPVWWKEEKAASLERKLRATPASARAQPGDAFLIVTEGKVTEPVYFNLVKVGLQLSTVHVRVIPGDHSDPRHVIRTAEREAKEQKRKAKKGRLAINEPQMFDHVWAVVDTDVAVRQGFWNDVEQLAEARKVKLAHSTPCIEFWFLLHIIGYTTRADLVDGTTAKRVVKDALGKEYSTNADVAKEVIATFAPKWAEAVECAERVRRHHHEAATRSPANPSTEVDQLLRALNDSALPHLQKLPPSAN